jgi:hypothetical protein
MIKFYYIASLNHQSYNIVNRYNRNNPTTDFIRSKTRLILIRNQEVSYQDYSGFELRLYSCALDGLSELPAKRPKIFGNRAKLFFF